MKTIGIEIDGLKAILYAIELLSDGTIENLTGEFKTISIKDDNDNSQIREFQSTIHSFFDTVNPDKIGIIKRNSKGAFSSAPLSFKLEGLIQCYKKCEIQFVPSPTLTAYYKKHAFEEPTYKYQTNAFKLAKYIAS